MVSQQQLKENAYEGHESRIQRLEVASQDLSVKTAEITIEVKGLSERVVSGFDNLAQKLDDTVLHISEHIKQQQEVVVGIIPTVKKLSDIQEKKDRRINFLTKCTWVIITGLLTLATEKICTSFFGG
jgi:hypothetical protein